MMLALLAAFQLAAATGGRALDVKDANRSLTVPLAASAEGPMLRADQLRPIIPVTVSHVTGERWMLIVGGSAIEVENGVRFARVGEDQFQLARAPEVRRGALYVPLQLVVELIPRVAGNLAWDPDRFELRAFSAVARSDVRLAARTDDRSTVQQGRPAAAPRRDDDDLLAAERTPPVSLATSAVESVGLRSRRLVVVDAGHGGPDPGMHGPLGGGPRVTEKAV